MWVVLCAALGTFLRVPTRGELSEVRGTLESYSISDEKPFHNKLLDRFAYDYVFNPTTILRFQESRVCPVSRPSCRAVSTTAVSTEQARTLFGKLPVAIRVFVNRQSDPVPATGAVLSYGLSVNGRDMQTVESALRTEWFLVRMGCPAIGITLVIVVTYQRRRRGVGAVQSLRSRPPSSSPTR